MPVPCIDSVPEQVVHERTQAKEVIRLLTEIDGYLKENNSILKQNNGILLQDHNVILTMAEDLRKIKINTN